MGFKIEALKRMKAMGIKRGDNYSNGPYDALGMLDGEAKEFRIESYNAAAGQVLLSHNTNGRIRFILAICKPDFPELFANAKNQRMQIFNLKPLAFVTAYKEKKDFAIDAIWVTPNMRKKGIAKTLYTLVHHKSPTELTSSSDLGTMSLATWLSLYKSNKSIYIKYVAPRQLPIPIRRTDITINDLAIYAKINGKQIELTSKDTHDFIFVWPK